jgi:hypothetical protein
VKSKPAVCAGNWGLGYARQHARDVSQNRHGEVAAGDGGRVAKCDREAGKVALII